MYTPREEVYGWGGYSEVDVRAQRKVKNLILPD